jgi:hypothetical protein
MIESEKKIESYLRKSVEGLGGLALKLPSVHFIGLPDRVCLLPGGSLFFAELKTTKKKPTKIQIKVHEKIKALGFNLYVIDSSAQIDAILKEYERR